jgi:hypothetical protein
MQIHSPLSLEFEGRRIAIAIGHFEEGDVIGGGVAVTANIEKHVHVTQRLMRGRVFGDIECLNHRETQNILVKRPGLFGVAAAIGRMMGAQDGRLSGVSWGSRHGRLRWRDEAERDCRRGFDNAQKAWKRLSATAPVMPVMVVG